MCGSCVSIVIDEHTLARQPVFNLEGIETGRWPTLHENLSKINEGQ